MHFLVGKKVSNGWGKRKRKNTFFGGKKKKKIHFFLLYTPLLADQMEAMVRQYVVWCLSVTAQYIQRKVKQTRNGKLLFSNIWLSTIFQMAMKNIQVWQLPVCRLPCSSERLQKSWGSSVFGSPYGGKQKLNKNLASLAALVGVIKNKEKIQHFWQPLWRKTKTKTKQKQGQKSCVFGSPDWVYLWSFN